VGGGFSVVASNYEAKTALRNLGPGNPADGRLKFDDHDVGFGGNAGLMIEPQEGTRFGISIRTNRT
jgi:hypothetical protein